MDEMKGMGRVAMTCLKDNGIRLELLRFDDGSVSIRVDGRAVGVWEWADQADGVAEFFGMTGVARDGTWADGLDMVLFVPPRAIACWGSRN